MISLFFYVSRQDLASGNIVKSDWTPLFFWIYFYWHRFLDISTYFYIYSFLAPELDLVYFSIA